MVSEFSLFGLLFFTCSLVLATENGHLQDLCVAEKNSPVIINGLTCKDPKLAQPDDFFFSGMHLEGDTSNVDGHHSNFVFVAELPGLNTLGISIGRNDFAPGGFTVPHTHPRASEAIIVLEGTLEVGLITSNPENRFIKKIVQKGDVFVIPPGLVHFSHNIGSCNAVTLVAFNSENPGIITATNGVFGTKPAISSDVLAKSFQVDENIIVEMQSKF